MPHGDLAGTISKRYIYLRMAQKLRPPSPAIGRYFDRLHQHVFKKTDLGTILEEHRKEWRLPQRMSTDKFIASLIENAHLKRVELTADDYRGETRFIWNEASPFELGLSLRPQAYLSHGTAVFLHGLNDQIPKTVYVNREQSPKPPSTQPPTQESISRAFQNAQRSSKYVFVHGQNRIVLLSGKNTGRLEVGDVKGPLGEDLEVTKLERTLIDITVRPHYAGGVHQVLAAFERAKDRVSVNVILTTLKQLGYVYPYHQALGFYMKRAGYDPARTARLKKLGLQFHFYLDYGIKKPAFDSEWQLFHPQGL